MLDKDQEKALVEKTIKNLPDSYLKDILVEERLAIYMAIESDLCYLGLGPAQEQEKAMLANIGDEIKIAQAKLFAMKEEVRGLELRASQSRNTIQECQSMAQRIANVQR